MDKNTFYINSQGDIEFDKLNRIKMVSGNDEVRQNIEIELSSGEGEWFLNELYGVPWLDLLIKNYSEKMIRNELEKVIQQYGDATITEFEMTKTDGEQRSYDINFEANIDGETIPVNVEVT